MSLTEAMEREFLDWPYRHVEREVFGSDDPGEIVTIVDGFCLEHLGSSIAAYIFYAASIGSVHGLLLEDGRRVVVKVNRAAWIGHEHVRAVQTVQNYLVSRHDYPVPRPILGPTELCDGTASVESLIDEGSPVDARAPGARMLIASSLSHLIELLRPMPQPEAKLGSLLGILGEGQLWPEPHDRRFDFEGTARGAEWIDEIGWEARRRRAVNPGGPVIGHCDWRAEHLLFDGSRLSAVYDSDSFIYEPETWTAGFAAHAFTTDWSREPAPAVPTATEARAFLDDYTASRPTPFTPAEMEAAQAALAYASAYSARCEHSDALTEMGQHPPDHSKGKAFGSGFRGQLRDLTVDLPGRR